MERLDLAGQLGAIVDRELARWQVKIGLDYMIGILEGGILRRAVEQLKDDRHIVVASCSHGNDVPLRTDPPGLGSLGPRVADPRFNLGILEEELKMVSVRLEHLSSLISLAHDPEATKLPYPPCIYGFVSR
jgi:hypothetical protein